MTSTELRTVSKHFAKISTEEFLASFVKSKAPGASVVVVSDAVETRP